MTPRAQAAEIVERYRRQGWTGKALAQRVARHARLLSVNDRPVASALYVTWKRLAVALAMLLASGCTPSLGDPFWQSATLCTTAELVEPVAAAAKLWHDAAGTTMTVRVGERGCGDADVYAVSEVQDGPGMGGGTVPGDVQIRADLVRDPRAPRLIAHELGHLLIGGDGAHNPDARSLMHAVTGPEILETDVAAVGAGVE